MIVDDFDSALDSTQYLIDSGCKNIALISTIDNLSIGKLRLEGYLQALKNNNLPINENIILRTDSSEGLNEKVEAILL